MNQSILFTGVARASHGREHAGTFCLALRAPIPLGRFAGLLGGVQVGPAAVAHSWRKALECRGVDDRHASPLAVHRLAHAGATPYARCMDQNNDITPNILLEHLRQMEGRLGSKIDAVRDELKADIGDLRHRVDRLERNLSGQIGTIDQRVDAIEIENLPRRVRALEQTVGK